MRKITTVFLAAVLAGCSAIPLTPGAERVRITHSEPGKECKFLGDVTGNQGNAFSGAWTSNEDLETGARNDMKNKAVSMGGNMVVLLTQRAGTTGSRGGSSEQTNVTLTGNVYRCPD